MSSNFSPLFESTDEQVEPLAAKVTGVIPKWLAGDYLCVGPGVFDIQDFTMNHWCDGFAVVCKFSITNDQVTFTKRHLNSDAYCKAKAIGKPVFTEFGTKSYPDPSKGFFSKIISSVMPDLTDNECCNIFKLGDSVYVATESSNKRTLNVNTLQSDEKVDLTAAWKINLACSHVYFDPDGTGYTIGTSLTSGVKTQIFRINNTPGATPGSEFKHSTPLCTLPSRNKTSVSFAHSFGLAERKIVFIEQPLFMSGLKLASMTMKGKTIYDTMEWRPEDKNRFIVVDKSSGHVSPIVYESDESFFFYHHINTYEAEDQLVVDVVCHNSPEVMDKLWLKDLRKGVFNLNDKAVARRFNLPLIKSEKELMALPENENLLTHGQDTKAVRMGNKIILSGTNMTEPTYDLPTVNPSKLGKPYTYFYATSTYGGGCFHNSIVKVNVDTRDVAKWTGSLTEFPGEPVFVTSPGSIDEDDGLLISIVADTSSRETFLLIINARNMEEIARATVHSHVPYLLHGLFIGKLSA